MSEMKYHPTTNKQNSISNKQFFLNVYIVLAMVAFHNFQLFINALYCWSEIFILLPPQFPSIKWRSAKKTCKDLQEDARCKMQDCKIARFAKNNVGTHREACILVTTFKDLPGGSISCSLVLNNFFLVSLFPKICFCSVCQVLFSFCSHVPKKFLAIFPCSIKPLGEPHNFFFYNGGQ